MHFDLVVIGAGHVGVDDMIEVILHLGMCDDPANCPWDINGDGWVDGADVVAVILNFGPCP